MIRRFSLRTTVFFLLFSIAVPFLAASAQEPGLIPRELLFGNPVRSSPQISPDGTRLSYLAPSEKGVLNIWVRTIGKSDDRQVSNDTHRGIKFYRWAMDGQKLFYFQDLNGDENDHVYSVDLQNNTVRDLTPFQGIKAEEILLSRNHPKEMLVSLNLRNRSLFDVYRVDLESGAILLDTQNPGNVLSWVADRELKVRCAMAQDTKDGSTSLLVRDDEKSSWRELMRWPFGDEGNVVSFTLDGKALYLETSLGADTTRLVKVDIASGRELETIASDPKADMGAVLLNPNDYTVEAVSFNYLRNGWKILSPKVREDFSNLSLLGDGEFSVTGRDNTDKQWIVTYRRDDAPLAWYLYDREKKKSELLFLSQPELLKHKLSKMTPVVIKSRDGLPLVSYLTVPAAFEGKRGLPLVLFVHGGPWGRDVWGYSPNVQWLADRGYAVLQVNFRSSTGFGKRFLNAGNGEWGVGSMQHDLTDAVQWALSKGIADPKKICIFGGSYGGYATLAGLAFTPSLYSCGVDLVGPSNISTLLQAIPPYWAPMKKQMVLRIGDVENDEALNKRISPLFHAQNIRVPLLIGQGANDPRVNIREADQMVQAMRAKGLEVAYYVYTDEGHGFSRPSNKLDFYGRVEEFLAKNLGGRAEPWKKIEGSSVEVR